MLRSWICLCISVFKEMDRLGSSFEKKDTITGKCEHLLSRVYPILSEHRFRVDIRNISHAFEEVGESVFRGGHDWMDYIGLGIPQS